MALFRRKKKEKKVEAPPAHVPPTHAPPVHPHVPPPHEVRREVPPYHPPTVAVPEKIPPEKPPKVKPEEEVARPEIESETEIFKKFWHWMWQAKGTMSLIIITIISSFLIWFISPFAAETQADFLKMPVGIVRYLVSSPSNLLEGNIASLVTPVFVHGNTAHLFGNMLFLLAFGRIIERKFGTAKMLAVYFFAAAFSSLVDNGVQIIRGTNEWGAGASGAIAGLILLALLIRPFEFTYIFGGLPLPIIFVGWLGILNDIFALLIPRVGDIVGHIAHLGGAVSIFFILFLLLGKKDRPMAKRNLLINLGFAGVFILLMMFIGDVIITIAGILCLTIVLYKIVKKPKTSPSP